MTESNSKIRRIDRPDDPERCQANFALGQCWNKRVSKDIPYCEMHGAYAHLAQQKRKETRLYLSALYQQRIGEHADHPKIKTLREEVGILRMTLDNLLCKCKDEKDLLMHTPRIIEIVREVTKTVQATTKLEQIMGHVLDKNQALAWITELLDMVAEELPDPEKLQSLALKMIESLERRTNGASSL